MPDPSTEQRLSSVERSLDRLQDSLQQLVEVQKELKELSVHLVELLSNNRFIGTRVEIMENKLGQVINVTQELQIQQSKSELQISGIWKVFGIINAMALALFGWLLSKFG